MTSKIQQQILQDQENRKKLSSDLRKSHFNHSTPYDKDLQSVSKSNFVEHDLKSYGETKEQMKNLQGDLRSQHFRLGNDDPKKLFQTTANISFQVPTNVEKAQLSQAAKADLRSHHFVFGYANDKSHQSDYKGNFQDKPFDKDVSKNRQEQVQQLRKNNYQFGDNKNYFSTVYNETLNKQYDPNSLGQGLSKDQITQQIVELRKTNLSVGTAAVKYTSEAAAEYKDYGAKGKAAIIDQDLVSHHYKLGTDKNDYLSQAQATYQGEFQLPDKGLTGALSKDLRKEHFVLGYDERNFQSEAKKHYQEYDLSKTKIIQDKNRFQKANFDLGQHGTFNEGAHKFATQQSLLKQVPPNQVRNDKMDRGSSIVLGSDKVDQQFTTEARANFLDFTAENAQNRGKLDDNLKKDLKSHHYQFGTDETNFVSQTKDTYVTKTEGKGFLDEDLKNDLRKNHFTYGTQHNDWKTTTGINLVDQKSKPSKLDPNLAKDLRGHHFQFGNHDLNYATHNSHIYKDWYKN